MKNLYKILLFVLIFGQPELFSQWESSIPSTPHDYSPEIKSSMSFDFGLNYLINYNSEFDQLLYDLGYDNLPDNMMLYNISMDGDMASGFYFAMKTSFKPYTKLNKKAGEYFKYSPFLFTIPFGYSIKLSKYFKLIPFVSFSIGGVSGEFIKNHAAGSIDINDLLYDDNLKVIDFYSTEVCFGIGTKFKYLLPQMLTPNSNQYNFLNHLSFFADFHYNHALNSSLWSGDREIGDFQTHFLRGINISIGVGYEI